MARGLGVSVGVVVVVSVVVFYQCFFLTSSTHVRPNNFFQTPSKINEKRFRKNTLKKKKKTPKLITNLFRDKQLKTKNNKKTHAKEKRMINKNKKHIQKTKTISILEKNVFSAPANKKKPCQVQGRSVAWKAGFFTWFCLRFFIGFV